MKISGAIFDLDGTLIDSMPIWNNLAYNFIVSMGVAPKPDLRDKVSTMFLRESSEYIVSEYKLDCTAEDVLAYMHGQINDFYINQVPPKQDIIAFLEKLKAENIKMCVATATERRLAEASLKLNGMLEYFDEIFTCAEIGISKQSPEIFELALESLGTPKSETFVFEDSPHAAITANKAGFPVVSIYDKAAASKAEEMKANSVCYINRYEELNSFFDNIK